MKTDIGLLLESLKITKSSRTRKSLDKLNKILQDYFDVGGTDFSITNIGRLSKKNGGPSYETIRATRNSHYRMLIEAWFANLDERSTVKNAEKVKIERGSGFDLLEKLDDVSLRVAFGQIIAERNKLKRELNILKANTAIVIDKRALNNIQSLNSNSNKLDTNFELKKKLTSSELAALKFALSEECLLRNDWTSTKAGQIKTNDTCEEVFPRGYLTALKKLFP